MQRGRDVYARALLIALVGCSAHAPATLAPQPTSALVPVPYPPPPARVEEIPDAPERATWIDGEWIWIAGRWLWQSGRFVRAPAGARWSPSVMVRDARGALYWARGAWRDARGREVREPRALRVAASVGAVVVLPSGDAVVPGEVLPPPGEPR